MREHLSFLHCLADAYRAAEEDGYTHAASMRCWLPGDIVPRQQISVLLRALPRQVFRESIIYNRDSGWICGQNYALLLYRHEVTQ